MHLKTGFFILLTSLVLTGLTSCLGDDEFVDSVVSTDAQLVSFGIAHDSIAALSSVVFSIDQVKGEIYNHDSLPYQTDFSTIEKLKINFTTGSGLATQIRVEYATDSTWIASGDSAKFTNPLSLRVYAQDQKISKEYTVKFNVHQIDPDSVQYHSITTATIPDSIHYTELAKDCPYTVVAVLGLL
jgi:hypothetical protein